MNPFQVLGLKDDASLDDIKKAFRTLSMQYHPDKNDSEEAIQKFREVRDAYELINTEQKIQRYRSKKANPLNWDSDMETFFKDFFGNGRAAVKKTVYVTVSITLEEAFKGGKKSFFYRVAQTCAGCGGTGATQFDSHGRVRVICEKCTGRGTIAQTLSASVDIPQSVEHGKIIPADNGAVQVTISLVPHNSMERRQFDIFSEITIPLIQVFDGSSVTVNTLHGPVEIQIPKCIQNDQQLRIRNHGMWDFRKNAFADHIIKLKIQIPKLPDEICSKIVECLLGAKKEEESGS